MHKISICSIVKNEPDLVEWITYHKLIGFDHIYIYNNNDENNYKNKDFCTFIKFPGHGKQIDAYRHFLQNYKQQTEYVCFIDADEFAVFSNDFCDIKQIIEKFPKDLDSVVLNWKMFINNKNERSDLVMDNTKWQKMIFREKKETKNLNFHKGIKTLSKTNVIKDIADPHYVIYNKEPNVYCGDLKNKKQIIQGIDRRNQLFYLETEPFLWINHYYIKSLPEFKYKCDYNGNGMGIKKNYKDELRKFESNLCDEPTNILNWRSKVLEEMKNYDYYK